MTLHTKIDHTHPKRERTLVIIKPDAVQRTLVGEIIQRYERLGLKIVGMKLVRPTKDLVDKHYTNDPDWIEKTGAKFIKHATEHGLRIKHPDPVKMGEHILERLSKYMTSGPVIAMVLQGLHAVPIVRKITGSTEPLQSDVGTIRGDFVLDSYEFSDIQDRSIRNLVHASGSVEEANKEIALWFTKDELINYTLVQEKILYETEIDGIFE